MGKYDIYYVLTIALLLVALYNTYLLFGVNKVLPSTPANTTVLPSAEKLQVIAVTCKDCADVNPILDSLKGAIAFDQKIVDYTKAGDLVKKYSLKQVPVLIMTGNVPDQVKQSTTPVNEGYVIPLPPPYLDLASGVMKGRVTITTVSKGSCTVCANMSAIVDQLNSSISIKERKVVDADSSEGVALIKQYNITKLPAIMFDEALEAYPQFSTINASVNHIDGQYVLKQALAPYYDLSDNSVHGAVSLTIIKDSACSDCYDPNAYQTKIFQQMGVYITKTTTLDLVNAKDLVKKYNITKIPTVIMEGDVAAYPALVDSWKDVGTVENGAYVFRNVEVFQQPYKNISVG